MTLIEVNGTSLAYDDAGEGDAVVLVHGSWNQRQAWMFFIPELSSSFRVVSYDRRGHGESTAAPMEGTLHDDIADLAGLIDELGIGPAYVVGNSYGAIVSLSLAATRPDIVRKVVAHEPPLLPLLDADPATKPIADEQWRLLGEVRTRLEAGDHAGAAEYFVENVALGPGAWAQLPQPARDTFVANAPTYLGELRDPGALRADLDALARSAVRVLLSQGDQSPAMFGPILDRVAAALPDAKRSTLAGAGHIPHMTHPSEYGPIVRSFLLAT
jgi:pimeloyl-ACP methyl ester carboxylesterase